MLMLKWFTAMFGTGRGFASEQLLIWRQLWRSGRGGQDVAQRTRSGAAGFAEFSLGVVQSHSVQNVHRTLLKIQISRSRAVDEAGLNVQNAFSSPSLFPKCKFWTRVFAPEKIQAQVRVACAIVNCLKRAEAETRLGCPSAELCNGEPKQEHPSTAFTPTTGKYPGTIERGTIAALGPGACIASANAFMSKVAASHRIIQIERGGTGGHRDTPKILEAQRVSFDIGKKKSSDHPLVFVFACHK